MKGRLRLCIVLLLALALLTYALFVAPSSNPIGRAASRIARRLFPGHEPIADVVEEHLRRDGDVFGVSIWARHERYTRAPGYAFWYEFGRGLPESLKRRWRERAMGELPQPPDTDAMLVPAPALAIVCQTLGPESLDQWVLLVEAKTSGRMRDLTGKLDRRGIEWKVFGHDLCVRRRDRAPAIEKLGLAWGSDAYLLPCAVSVRTEQPDRYVAELTRVLEEARLPGFVDVSKEEGGEYYLKPYIRFALLQPNPDQRALDLNERIRSTLAQLGAEATVFQMFPWMKSLDKPAGDSQGPRFLGAEARDAPTALLQAQPSRNDHKVFGVLIWTERETYPTGSPVFFAPLSYEVGRGLSDDLKRRWSEAMGTTLPYAPDADTVLLPAPAIEKACEVLGPESLDLWVLLAEVKTPEDRRELTDRLDRRDIEWKTFGDDVCVRRRDRVTARERLGLTIGMDAYSVPCCIHVTTDDPSSYVDILSQSLKEEGLTGFVRAEKGADGTHDLVLFVRWGLFGRDAQRALDLARRVASRLRELGVDAD